VFNCDGAREWEFVMYMVWWVIGKEGKWVYGLVLSGFDLFTSDFDLDDLVVWLTRRCVFEANYYGGK
jgi:hypothetical protein